MKGLLCQTKELRFYPEGKGQGPRAREGLCTAGDIVIFLLWIITAGQQIYWTAWTTDCLNFLATHLPNPPASHFHWFCPGETEMLRPREIALSAHCCLILTSKNYSSGVSSSRVLIWQKAEFALSTVSAETPSTCVGNLEIAFLKRAVDKGRCCSGKRCLFPARRRWRTLSKEEGQIALNSSFCVFFLSLVFFHFYISISFLSRHVLWEKVKRCFLGILCTSPNYMVLMPRGKRVHWRQSRVYSREEQPPYHPVL